MKYSATEYAKYLVSLIDLPLPEQKSSLHKFAEVLHKNGDLKDWNKISEIYESLKEKSAKSKTAVVNYCGDIDKTKIESELKNYKIEFEEDKTLKGGVRIRIGDLRIDNSLAGRLADVKKALI